MKSTHGQSNQAHTLGRKRMHREKMTPHKCNKYWFARFGCHSLAIRVPRGIINCDAGWGRPIWWNISWRMLVWQQQTWVGTASTAFFGRDLHITSVYIMLSCFNILHWLLANTSTFNSEVGMKNEKMRANKVDCKIYGFQHGTYGARTEFEKKASGTLYCPMEIAMEIIWTHSKAINSEMPRLTMCEKVHTWTSDPCWHCTARSNTGRVHVRR